MGLEWDFMGSSEVFYEIEWDVMWISSRDASSESGR